MGHLEWEKSLGIACALFKGFFKEREYKMSLETDRTSRDYDRVPARGVRSDQEVIDSGKAGVHISERPQAS
jgi:hypothetical protein